LMSSMRVKSGTSGRTYPSAVVSFDGKIVYQSGQRPVVAPRRAMQRPHR
jgi:hypothetical protein